MAITINGTTGIAGVDGSASAPAVQGSDTNTGIAFPAADTVTIATGGSERIRVDSSGQLGIGTTSPDALLTVNGVGAFGDGTVSAPSISNTGDLNTGAFFPAADQMAFAANGAEVFRITKGGLGSSIALGIGTTSPGVPFVVVSDIAGTQNAPLVGFESTGTGDVGAAVLHIAKKDNNTTTSNPFIRFYINNSATGSGQINANGASAAAFGTFSDERLKENIVNLPSQLQNVCSLRPVEFDYKDGSGHQIGFIAQEMQSIYPDAIGETEGMLTITGWSKTEARLVKAIQELKAELDATKQRLAALEGK